MFRFNMYIGAAQGVQLKILNFSALIEPTPGTVGLRWGTPCTITHFALCTLNINQ